MSKSSQVLGPQCITVTSKIMESRDATKKYSLSSATRMINILPKWRSVKNLNELSENRPVSQIRAPLGGLSRTSGSYDKTTQTAICFEHKTQYLLIRAPYTHIVVFWHISNIPPMISQSQISCNTPTFYIATIFVKYCYTTGSWLL